MESNPHGARSTERLYLYTIAQTRTDWKWIFLFFSFFGKKEHIPRRNIVLFPQRKPVIRPLRQHQPGQLDKIECAVIDGHAERGRILVKRIRSSPEHTSVRPLGVNAQAADAQDAGQSQTGAPAKAVYRYGTHRRSRRRQRRAAPMSGGKPRLSRTVGRGGVQRPGAGNVCDRCAETPEGVQVRLDGQQCAMRGIGCVISAERGAVMRADVNMRAAMGKIGGRLGTAAFHCQQCGWVSVDIKAEQLVQQRFGIAVGQPFIHVQNAGGIPSDVCLVQPTVAVHRQVGHEQAVAGSDCPQRLVRPALHTESKQGDEIAEPFLRFAQRQHTHPAVAVPTHEALRSEHAGHMQPRAGQQREDLIRTVAHPIQQDRLVRHAQRVEPIRLPLQRFDQALPLLSFQTARKVYHRDTKNSTIFFIHPVIMWLIRKRNKTVRQKPSRTPYMWFFPIAKSDYARFLYRFALCFSITIHAAEKRRNGAEYEPLWRDLCRNTRRPTGRAKDLRAGGTRSLPRPAPGCAAGAAGRLHARRAGGGLVDRADGKVCRRAETALPVGELLDGDTHTRRTALFIRYLQELHAAAPECRPLRRWRRLHPAFAVHRRRERQGQSLYAWGCGAGVAEIHHAGLHGRGCSAEEPPSRCGHLRDRREGQSLYRPHRRGHPLRRLRLYGAGQPRAGGAYGVHRRIHLASERGHLRVDVLRGSAGYRLCDRRRLPLALRRTAVHSRKLRTGRRPALGAGQLRQSARLSPRSRTGGWTLPGHAQRPHDQQCLPDGVRPLSGRKRLRSRLFRMCGDGARQRLHRSDGRIDCRRVSGHRSAGREVVPPLRRPHPLLLQRSARIRNRGHPEAVRKNRARTGGNAVRTRINETGFSYASIIDKKRSWKDDGNEKPALFCKPAALRCSAASSLSGTALATETASVFEFDYAFEEYWYDDEAPARTRRRLSRAQRAADGGGKRPHSLPNGREQAAPDCFGHEGDGHASDYGGHRQRARVYGRRGDGQWPRRLNGRFSGLPGAGREDDRQRTAQMPGCRIGQWRLGRAGRAHLRQRGQLHPGNERARTAARDEEHPLCQHHRSGCGRSLFERAGCGAGHARAAQAPDDPRIHDHLDGHHPQRRVPDWPTPTSSSVSIRAPTGWRPAIPPRRNTACPERPAATGWRSSPSCSAARAATSASQRLSRCSTTDLQITASSRPKSWTSSRSGSSAGSTITPSWNTIPSRCCWKRARKPRSSSGSPSNRRCRHRLRRVRSPATSNFTSTGNCRPRCRYG